jgi:anti-sigma B factor antagonist
MSLLAQIEEEPGPERVAIASVAGEIDASNTAELAARLRAMLSNRHEALVVDLSETTYLDSAAINLFFQLGSDLVQRQQRLHLVVPERAPIARALAITGLDAAVAVHPDRAGALGPAAA